MHASGPIAFMLFAYIVLLKVSILHACIRMHFFIRELFLFIQTQNFVNGQYNFVLLGHVPKLLFLALKPNTCYNIDIQVYAAASHKLLLEGGVVNWPVNRHVSNSISV